MYLHIGSDISVNSSELIGIFDLDNTTISRNTRAFLDAAERAGDVVSVSFDIPRSFVLCEKNGRQTVFISPISSATLRQRAGKTDFDESFLEGDSETA